MSRNLRSSNRGHIELPTEIAVWRQPVHLAGVESGGQDVVPVEPGNPIMTKAANPAGSRKGLSPTLHALSSAALQLVEVQPRTGGAAATHRFTHSDTGAVIGLKVAQVCTLVEQGEWFP